MRRLRRLIPVVILAVAALVAGIYLSQRRSLKAQAQPPPASLPAGVQTAGNYFHWSRTFQNRPAVYIRAKNFRQVGEKTELSDVELKLYQKDGKLYDRVVSAKAIFDAQGGTLYSDGDVEITMGLAEEGVKPGHIVSIHSSGVTYDNTTGKASTDRLAKFSLDTGDGQAVGASYDPVARELHLKSQVEVNWKGRGPKSTPMKIETGELVYKEAADSIGLAPWSRLTRGTMTLNGASSNIELVEGAIRRVTTQQAQGVDTQPGRRLAYEAQNLAMLFTPKGEIENLTAADKARLVSTADTGATTILADRVDLEFTVGAAESTLRKATALGAASVESRPAQRGSAPAPDTRILRSDAIEMQMRAGGEEIEAISTHATGKLEFLPNHPKARRRTLDGDRIWITYGPKNQIESFRSVSVATRTEGDPGAKPPAPPQLTWSKDLQAGFDPVTGQMTKLEQWTDFRYEEGPRRAKAERATLDSPADRITLEGSARVWDAGGATSGDRIVLEQKTGDFAAFGKVSSTREPEKKKSAAPGMLSGDAPLQARAQQMRSTGDNRKITYEGQALLWQGSNRIEADRVDIDRAAESLHATGSVVSQFLDNSSKTKKGNRPALTIVKAAELNYTGKEKIAHYRGGVLLERPGLEVNSRELRAFLKEDAGGTTLDKAIAERDVKIVEKNVQRKRIGTGDRGEYYTAEERLVLSGGSPMLVDSLKGSTRGNQLTYFSNTDKLLVDGAGEPAVSRILRK